MPEDLSALVSALLPELAPVEAARYATRLERLVEDAVDRAVAQRLTRKERATLASAEGSVEAHVLRGLVPDLDGVTRRAIEAAAHEFAVRTRRERATWLRGFDILGELSTILPGRPVEVLARLSGQMSRQIVLSDESARAADRDPATDTRLRELVAAGDEEGARRLLGKASPRWRAWLVRRWRQDRGLAVAQVLRHLDGDGLPQSLEHSADALLVAGFGADAAGNLSALGEVERKGGDHGAAERAYLRARELYLRLGSPDEAADCLALVALERQDAGQLSGAEKAITQARVEFAARGRVAESAGCTGTLGSLHLAAGRLAFAEEAHAQAWTEYHALGLAREAAGALHNKARVLVVAGRLAEAGRDLREAWKVFDSLGDDSSAALCVADLGTVDQALGRLPEAENAYQRARATHSELGEGRYATTWLMNLGTVHASQGDYARAAREFEQAWSENISLGREAHAADCLLNLGKAQLGMGDLRQARRSVTHARKAYQRLGRTLEAADCVATLAAARALSGRRRAAGTMYGKARAEYSALGVPLRVALCDLRQALLVAAARRRPDTRAALALAVPALLYVDARRFTFPDAATRLSWARLHAEWTALVFLWAEQSGDTALVAELVETAVNAGVHSSAPLREPDAGAVWALGDNHLRYDDCPRTAPPPQDPGSLGAGAVGAVRLVARAPLPLVAPPRLLLAPTWVALERHRAVAEQRFGVWGHDQPDLPTW